MKTLTYCEALREALREELIRDKSVFILGEDVGSYGGAFGVTKGLVGEFGPQRIMDTPISETAIMGITLGAASTGMRPVAEIMFMDFIGVCMDEIVNQAAKIRYMFGGKALVPMVIRVPAGGGLSAAAQHSQCLEAWLTHVPGLKVVAPSTPYDAKGLLKASIRDDDPVVFIEHKALYDALQGEVPEEDYIIPLGKADVKREGKDITVVATMKMVHEALAAAETLQQEGISVEVVDLRSLVPLDKETILQSVKKTSRVVVAEEAIKRNGYGAEIASMIAEEVFDYLDGPVKRVAAKNTPIPFSPNLEKYVLPGAEDIVRAVKSVLK